MDNYKVKLFYADWCGHCRNFKPIWEQFKNFLKENTSLRNTDNKIIKIVTEEYNDSNVMELEIERVEGFPTIIIYKNNTEDRNIYTGDRSLSGLKKHFKLPVDKLPVDKLPQTGGNNNYYDKYMKYKLKYYNLKHN